MNRSFTRERIVIVGGVAGGASAAARARRCNEQSEIILLEKDEYVSFANCGLPYYIGGEITDREKLLVTSADFLEQRFNLDVRTRHEAIAIDRNNHILRVTDHVNEVSYDQPYDKLILAPGAAPIVPPLRGADADNIFTLRNVNDTDRIKRFVDDQDPQRAVVVGGGYIGLEMVEQLHRRGVEVALVELLPQVLPLLDPEMAEPIQETLEAQGVSLHLGDGLAGLHTENTGQVSGVSLNSGQSLSADMVILAIGVRPNIKLAQDAGLSLGGTGGISVNHHMQTEDPAIYAVGDAVEYPFGPTGGWQRVALGGPANRAGRIAGEHAATGYSAPMASVQGTAIVRAFELIAASAGLSEKNAAKHDIHAQSVTIIAAHHAGYYPGAKPITLKLIFQPEDGKILGAQVVGEAGVDKRIDVISTAMHFGATAHDLAGVDLAYAPPFGAAKDPLHMAAFAASNWLHGWEQFLSAYVDLRDYQVVDVRSDEEVTSKPLPDALHAKAIPVDTLRDRLNELDPNQPTVTVCGSGARSHVAARLLSQSGFSTVFNLTGGQAMRRRALRTRDRQPVS